MLDPVTLFEFESHIDRRTVRARKLVVTLGSRDAGHTQRIIDTHLLNTLRITCSGASTPTRCSTMRPPDR